MIKIIQTEFKKLKRFHILLIGLIGMAFPSVLAVFTQSVATTGTNPNFDFQALFDSSIWNSVTIFMPIVFTLIGGYIINREYTDDTLKNIFPIPISFKKLVGGKLLTMAILSLLLGIYSFIVTVIIGKISGLEGLNTSVISKNLFQFIGITICVYISVLPIMAFTSRKEGMYLGGVILSFILGYSAMFIKSPLIRSIYPMLSGFSVVGFDTSTFMNTTEPTNVGLSFLTLVLCMVISVVIIARLNPQKKEHIEKEKKELFSRK